MEYRFLIRAMMNKKYTNEEMLMQLKAHTPLYIELPFNTGDFLVIAHYKLIAHYRQALKLPGDQVRKRKELHEEVLFQLHKVLVLTLLTDEQLEKLREYKALHEQILDDLSGSTPDQTP